VSWIRALTAVLASSLLCASLAAAAGFTEYEDRPTKDPDNSEDDPLATADPVPWNLAPFSTAFPGGAKLIRGTLDARDVDAYAFSLSSGQLVLAALFETAAGEKNDTSLGLFGPTGPAAATDDDSGSGFLSRLAFNVSSTSTQRIVVTGFGDTSFNGTHQEAKAGLVPYTLVVAAVPNPPPFSESESNNTLATANALSAEAGVTRGTLSANDVDYFKLDLEPGDRLAVSVFDLKPGLFQVAGGERNDTVVGLFTPAGALAAGGTNDDGGPGFQSNLLFTVPAGQGGTWKIAVTGFGDGAFTGAHKETSFQYLHVTANLRGGDFYYIDRTTPGQHTLVDVPAAYECSQWIKTANDDKNVSTASHLGFNLSQASSVFVAYDTRATSEPSWLATGFTPTGEIADVADPDKTQEFRLLRRDFPTGAVTLGGNNQPVTGAGSNYLVFARPLDLADPTHAFSIPGLPAGVLITINGSTLQVNRLSGQTAAQFAASIAAAINANFGGMRIFAMSSGVTFVTTGTLQSVVVQANPIPALPFAWAVALCAALAAVTALGARRRDTGRAARSG